MSAVAPTPPGRLGEPVDPDQMLRYLTQLSDWCTGRRDELDQLDRAVMASPHRDTLTRDVMLSLALWQAVRDRRDLLMASWDSGRVGPRERKRLAALVWGRLDATLDPALLARAVEPGSSGPGSLAVSLPEACRLSDALAGQLRTQLQLDPHTSANRARLRDLRAQLERLRDQVLLEPAGSRLAVAQTVAELSERVERIDAKAGRGGDVGGLLGPAEIEAARLERDLIVQGAQRRQASGLVDRATELRDDLESREGALHHLVERCLARVTPSPKYAVPDVAALGAVPTTRPEAEAYLRRLDQVSRAMQVVQHSYSNALAEPERLTAQLDTEVGQARSHACEDDPDLAGLEATARDLLQRRPCPAQVVSELVDGYRAAVAWKLTTTEDR